MKTSKMWSQFSQLFSQLVILYFLLIAAVSNVQSASEVNLMNIE